MSQPSLPTVKRLFAVSGNICAFLKCTMPLIDGSGSVIGQICHIKGKNAGSARYDIAQTNEQRNAFENLIVMCLVHHKVIDDDEESYPVEKLQKLKIAHENQHRNDNKKDDLEELVEKHLSSIFEKSNSNLSSSKIIEEANNSLLKAQKLAATTMYNTRRQEWKYSHNGYIDSINSVNEIFSLIINRFTENASTFETLGIGFFNGEEGVCNVSNIKFGSQLELERFSGYSNQSEASNITLKLWLFKKEPSYQPGGGFYSHAITRIWLKPDISPDDQVIWRDKENNSTFLTAEEVCEKLFSLLIDKISEPLPLDESVEGGRFSVDGQIVNAFNEPIDGDDYDYPFDY